MNKGVIFWVVWATVVGGAVGCYFLLVYPKVSENALKTRHRDLLAARLIRVGRIDGVVDEDATGQIRTMAKKLATTKGGKVDPDLQAKLFPEELQQILPLDVDKKIYGLYPLGEARNLKLIPNETNVAAKEKEVKFLVAERNKFVESFGKMQFAVDLTRDFDPAPPGQSDLFRQWVMGSAERPGQDQKIDRMIEEKLGKGCMRFCTSEMRDPTMGAFCEWLSDGRCSGYIDDRQPEVRSTVLKRLVLRRLVLMAVTRAGAPVQTLVKDEYGPGGKFKPAWEDRQRRVQFVDSLTFLDGAPGVTDATKGFMAARNQRYGQAQLPPPSAKDNPAPYRSNGFKLQVRCHPAVVPSLISELERIGEVENRPFACWVERVLMERPGKPDWRPDAVVFKPEDLSREDGGNRLHEWPISVEVLAVVPDFDEKLDPQP